MRTQLKITAGQHSDKGRKQVRVAWIGKKRDGSIAERMTTVIATPDGFLAGGSIGPELFERHARFWRSADGAEAGCGV